jgi:uncharacterized protein Smg (DUF494 family)
MSDDRERAALQRILILIAEQLEAFLEGDELALETLGESLEQGSFTADDLQAAILALRSRVAEPGGATLVACDDPPGAAAHRVLGAHERDSLSPEAWGFLLDLRRRGSLDPEQFERVLDRLTTSGVRPVGVDLAREVATHVALRTGDEAHEFGPTDGDVAH